MFQFMKNNHTVTQSTFAKPCVKMSGGECPLTRTEGKERKKAHALAGFDSNFMPNVNNTQVPPPTASYTVTSKDPTWFYCKQKTGNHCGKGMVFAINPTAEKSLDMFKSMAIQQNGTTSTTAAASAGTSTAVTLIANPPGSSVQAPPPIVTGSGQSGNGASCSCQCLCAIALFPPGAGIGNFGGYGGSLPMPT
ncbi:hypothetical protein FGG08_001856 [Glutinoglossum americanum]|uniref:Uncharacterized protein n=1 Tax=Glutinoglossum americanum TaxID=1670608 RepID=A0A9P8KZR0_9PEZI|nr:hypothetical protein FGG08_001856 [Glutinoglossum americanum]